MILMCRVGSGDFVDDHWLVHALQYLVFVVQFVESDNTHVLDSRHSIKEVERLKVDNNDVNNRLKEAVQGFSNIFMFGSIFETSLMYFVHFWRFC